MAGIAGPTASGSGAAGPSTSASNVQKQRAAFAALQNKPPIPTIDFTVHTMDDGQVVSTQGRVVKDVQAPAAYKPSNEQFYDAQGRPDHAFLKVRDGVPKNVCGRSRAR